MNDKLKALALAAAFLVVGAVVSRTWSPPLSKRGQTFAVPTALLDSGTLGEQLSRLNLLEPVPNFANDFSSPRSRGLDMDDGDLLAFPRKRQVGDELYRARPLGRAPEETHTHLPEELRNQGDLWVISVSLREDDLRGPERGILSHPDARIERRAMVSLFRKGVLLFEGPTGIKLHGGSSRYTILAGRRRGKNSFRLHFRERYGLEALDPGLLFNGEIDPVRNLVLRRTGRLASSISFELARLLRCDTPKTEPGLFYLNGEYMGVIMLTEHLSSRQWESRVGHDEFLMFRRRGSQDDAGAKASERLLGWAYNLLETRATTAEVERYLDLEQLTDYAILVAYCGTEDWEQAAMVLNVKDPNARWKWVLWDMDRSFSDDSDESLRPWQKASLEIVLDDAKEARTSLGALVFRALFRDDQEYRTLFAKRVSEVLNHVFTTDALNGILGKYATLLKEANKEDPGTVKIHRFVSNRAEVMRTHVAERMGLGAPVRVSFSCPQGSGIQLEVNGKMVPGNWTGTWFPGQTVIVRAVGGDAVRGVRWIVDGMRQPAGKLTLLPRKDTRVQAAVRKRPADR